MDSSVCRDLKCIERLGRFTALVPTASPSERPTCKQSVNQREPPPWNWTIGHNKRFPYNLWLLSASVIILVFESLWDWDTLKLNYFKRNSEKIHYATFQLAIWMSSTGGRLAFLITTPLILKLFESANSYLRDFMPRPPECQRPHPKGSLRYFKIICLILLNLIYVAQFVEFFMRLFNTETHDDLYKHCESVLISCDSGSVLLACSIAFKIVSSATLYYLTYLVITMSHLLLLILDSFQKDLVARWEGYCNEPGELDLVTPLFILKGGHRLSKGQKVVGKIQKDLHEQFSRMRSLFGRFNLALGPPLIVAAFSDTLIFICIVFSIIPKFGVSPTNAVNSGQQGYPSPDWKNSNVTYNETPGIMQPLNATSVEQPLNGTEDFNGKQFHTGGGYGGGPLPYIPKSSNVQGGQVLLAYAFQYIFAILYECRAILMAFIGSYLKFKIVQMKQHLDWKVQGASSNRLGTYDDDMVKSVVNRVNTWSWEFRTLDMVTMDLSLVPAMLGTVMTYVVVLLQIQISEG